MPLALQQSLGWPGCVGAGALLLAAGLALLATPRWQAQADAHLAGVQQGLRDRAARPAPAAVAVAGDWPLPAQTPDRAADLLALAIRHGVQVLSAREQQGVGGHLQSHSSVRADYAALRSYIAEALAADPALVLERLRLQRPQADSAELQADLQWTLLQRPAAPTMAAAP